MIDKIKEALVKLDVTKDAHWTSEGLPQIGIVKVLAGVSSVSRDEITNAAPGFTRANPVIGAPVVNETPAVATPAAVTGEPTVTVTVDNTAASGGMSAPLAAALVPLSAGPIGEEDPAQKNRSELDSLRLELQETNEDISDLIGMQAQAKAELDRLQNLAAQQGAAITKLEQGTGGDNPIAQYHASQKRLLEERGALQSMVRESGINLGELAKRMTSPLDHALKNRPRPLRR